MILSAGQPSYMPWLGTFAKIARAELWCSFDIADISRGDWTTRNYIKSAQGPLRLTVPVSHLDRRICNVHIVPGDNWARKHMRAIELAYRKAPYFEQHFAGVGAILDMYANEGLLADLNIDLLRYFMRALSIQVPIVSAYDYDLTGEKSALVLDMCVKLKASKYIFGGEGANYADQAAFREAGIALEFQNYECKPYPQIHGQFFMPRLSVLDLLMNTGPRAREFL